MDLSAAAGGAWLGGACFFGRLTPSQQRALPQHYSPLTFVASEGPLPDEMITRPPYTLVIDMTTLPNPEAIQSMPCLSPHSPANRYERAGRAVRCRG